MTLIDILIIGLVAVWVVTRFTKFKLPKDDRKPEQRSNPGDWRQLGRRALVQDEAPAAPARAVKKPTPKKADLSGLDGLGQIKALDTNFDEARFLEGAVAAYGYFYDRWNARDAEALANLCAPQLMRKLEPELDDAVPVAVSGTPAAQIAEARVNGRTAVIEVDFSATHSEDGGPKHTVRSRWVLARPLNSDDPNWELQQVRQEPAGTA